MASFRDYVLKRTVLLGLGLLFSVILLNYFSTKKVQDVYYQNLLYLSELLEKNIQFFVGFFDDNRVIELQLAEAVSKIPEVEAIYLDYKGQEFVFPEKYLGMAREVCKGANSSKVFAYNEYIVACLPLRVDYASSFIELGPEGKFVVIFSREKEEEFLASWFVNVLLLTFVFAGLGMVVVSSIWTEVRDNFIKLERLIKLVEDMISDKDKDKDKDVKALIEGLTLKEFRELGALIYYLADRFKRLSEEIKKLAITDPLTSLYNRNYMNIFVEGKLLPMWRRQKFPISVAILDLDNFKQINDTFGHHKGDEVLREWARIIKEELRGSDVPVRYGGEEIVIIFPYTRKWDAVKALERIKRRLAEVDFGIGRKVTFSAGVAGYPDDVSELNSLEGLIMLADVRLYKAKRTGKNKIVAD